MTPEELHRLVEEYRDGTISADDARRLAAAIRSDRASVLRELSFSGHLGQALEDAGDEAFVRSFSERLNAERGGDEFMAAFRKRAAALSRTRRAEVSRSSVLPYLVAAGFVLAILAAVLRQPPTQNVQPVAQKESIQVPVVEEPKVETPVAPVPPPEPPVRPPDPPKSEPSPVVVPEPPVKPPAPPPVKPRVEPKASPPRSTEVARPAVAKLARIEGDVQVAVENDRKPAKAGQDLLPGMGIFTAPKNSSAAIVLPDGTRITIGADATIRDIAKGAKGTRIFVALGTVTADVARQPADQPLTFVSPHGEAKVLGTVLRLVVDSTTTRLEVKEGKVQFGRDAKPVVVAAGQYAVAGAG